MRVGFDVSALEAPHSPGVRRVTRSLLSALEARARLEVVRLAPPRGTRLLTWRQLVLPRLVTERGLRGVHSFTSSVPLLEPGRRVQTVHELPWRHGESENAGLAHRLWASVGGRRADRILCPTEHVARDLRATLEEADGRRVRVVPWGVDGAFLAPDAAHDGDVLDRLVPEDRARGGRADGARQPWVLSPGGARPKKRLDLVLEAVAVLDRRGDWRARVLVTGAPGPAREELQLRARRLGLAGRVHWLGELSDGDLAVLLRNADAVPVLSRSEGFGLPVLEAYGAGCPVLVPAGTAQAEVAGGLGVSVASSAPGAVAEGLERCFVRDPAARRARRERARRFTWDATAAAVERVWEELG